MQRQCEVEVIPGNKLFTKHVARRLHLPLTAISYNKLITTVTDRGAGEAEMIIILPRSDKKPTVFERRYFYNEINETLIESRRICHLSKTHLNE